MTTQPHQTSQSCGCNVQYVGQRCRFHASPLATEWVKDMPIRNITNGWVLANGNLYLFVRCPDGVTRTVQVARA